MKVRPGIVVSAFLHAALLAWGLISFNARPLEAAPIEAMPVDIISNEQFSKMMKGATDAPKAEKPKPLVEKIAEQKLAEDTKPKVSEKKEIKTASAEPPPPPPEPEKKPDEIKDKKPEPKPDLIAETLKKEEAQKHVEVKKPPTPPKKPLPPQPKFDPSKVAALLDKRAPTRQASAGDTLNSVPSLGTATGTSAQLSQSELDALRARLAQLWNPPVGAENPEDLVVVIRVQLNRDGKLSGPPIVVTSGRGFSFDSSRDSAIRALFRGQPFTMLRPEHYEQWKDIEIKFDPREMVRG